jgi:hypothetical protein
MSAISFVHTPDSHDVIHAEFLRPHSISAHAASHNPEGDMNDRQMQQN